MRYALTCVSGWMCIPLQQGLNEEHHFLTFGLVIQQLHRLPAPNRVQTPSLHSQIPPLPTPSPSPPLSTPLTPNSRPPSKIKHQTWGHFSTATPLLCTTLPKKSPISQLFKTAFDVLSYECLSSVYMPCLSCKTCRKNPMNLYQKYWNIIF